MSRATSPAAGDKKPDRRRGRSRQACLNAFIELLLTTDYEIITVNDVIERAKVGRSTFYDYFTGKEDLLRECAANPFGLLADSLQEAADPAVLAGVLAHFRVQRRLVRRLLGGDTRALMVRSLAALIEARVGPGWPPGASAPTPVRLASLALAEMQLGMVAQWLEHSLEACPSEAFARVMGPASRSVADSFRGADSLRGLAQAVAGPIEPVRPLP